jgi:hypothetical protein
MPLTCEQQCQRADDECSEGHYLVVPAPVATAIQLMPRDDSHLREIARDVGRMFRGARS